MSGDRGEIAGVAEPAGIQTSAPVPRQQEESVMAHSGASTRRCAAVNAGNSSRECSAHLCTTPYNATYMGRFTTAAAPAAPGVPLGQLRMRLRRRRRGQTGCSVWRVAAGEV